MVAGRTIAIAFALGLVSSLSCGGRSVTEDGDDAVGGGSGGSVSTGGSSPQGGSNSKGGSSSGGSSGVAGNAGQNTGGAGSGTGARGGGGSSGNECDPNSAPRPGEPPVGGIPLVPDCEGWIDAADNGIGVQGGWYPFGDQYPGPYGAKCLIVGMHAPDECSIVHSPPPPPALGFPQTERGTMCTSGETAVVLPCADGLMTSGCPMYDYSNMTGAGIAVDFNAGRDEDSGARHPWDPTAAGIIGFSFEIDSVPLRFRVEVPMVLTDDEADIVSLPPGATTDEHPDGSPYWGASSIYPPSPVIAGVNRVLWSDIRPPRTSYVFDPTRMLGLQFHVFADTIPPKDPYAFCIKNLTLLLR